MRSAQPVTAFLGFVIRGDSTGVAGPKPLFIRVITGLGHPLRARKRKGINVVAHALLSTNSYHPNKFRRHASSATCYAQIAAALHSPAACWVFFAFVKITLDTLSRYYILKPYPTRTEKQKMITIDQAVIAQIKAEGEEFGFAATVQTIARDYFTRMSYEDKAVVMAANSNAKGVTALSRACVAMVAKLIEA